MIDPPAPTPPGMRDRTGRFTELTGPGPGNESAFVLHVISGVEGMGAGTALLLHHWIFLVGYWIFTYPIL